MAETIRGADILVQALKAARVSRVFSLSGNHIMPVYDALLGSGIAIIHTRHEAAAVHMADAWARLTGECGVALVTGGQGHTNALAALPTALAGEVPVLLLSGHAPLSELGLGAFQDVAAPLAVYRRLRGKVVRGGDVEFPVEDGIARGILVHVRRAMPDPLPCDEDRQLHMVLDLAHLEGRRVAVTHQVADQAAILVRRTRAAAIGYARGLHDRRIVAHVIHDAQEPMVEHRDGREQHRLQRRDARATRAALGGARGVDFLLLLGGQCHAGSLATRKARPPAIAGERKRRRPSRTRAIGRVAHAGLKVFAKAAADPSGMGRRMSPGVPDAAPGRPASLPQRAARPPPCPDHGALRSRRPCQGNRVKLSPRE